MSSIGTRATSVQLIPSPELAKTMSLAGHFLRNRQSSHATKTLPSAAISAVGSGLVRRPPVLRWKRMCDTVTALFQDAPPLSEEKLEIVPLRLSNGTITVPLGCTTGWPPRPLSLPAVLIGVPHVSPPSVDV